MILAYRPPPNRAAAPFHPRPRRSGRGPGAARRQVRRDVDLHELHVPVVQLPRPPARAPFFDLVANIAGEEFGHIELVATAINTMLTGAGEKGALPDPGSVLNPQQFIAGGAAALVQDSNGKPWNGDYVTSTGDLVEDLTHNFFLETGARNNKLKVYEMVDHPAARALTGYLLVRGGVHQIAYARAVERLTGADLMKLFPSPRIPTDQIPECQPHIASGEHTKLYRFSPERLPRAGGRLQRPPSRDRRRSRGRRRHARGLRAV